MAGRLRRRIVRVLIVVTVLALLGFVVSGWFFADVIENEALGVEPVAPARNLEVTAVEGDRVTLEVVEEDPWDTLDMAGTWGLSYDGGYARITGEPENDGGQSTRTFEVVTGEPPQVGQRAGTDLDAHPTEPMPPATEVTYESALGPMTAWFVPGEGTTWLIGLHGRGGGKQEMLRLMETSSALGLPGLSIDYRNDPGEPADPSGQYGFGATEWEDLAAAVAYAQEHGARDIVFAGSSMGGAIVASYLRHDPDAPVRGIILDSPVLDLRETVEWGAEQLGLPVGPPPPLTAWAMQLSTWRFGVDWDATDFLTDHSWLSVPTLVFHGADDTSVPVTTSRRLAADSPLVTLVETEDIDHISTWNDDPMAYADKVRRYLRAVGVG